MLAGNLAAIGVGGIVSTVWSYLVSSTYCSVIYCYSLLQKSHDQ